MNGLQLSNDLTTIETEIKSYQNIAGQSIFEIGRRLKHVKENDLAHGEFGNWLKNINLDRTQAHRFIKVSEEIKDVGTYQHLGLRALSEIASLPVPERTKEHTTSNGETKTPDEMTIRELRELKKQLKQRDEENAQLQSQMKQAQRSEEIARKQLEEVEDKEPEVIERYMEPEDYQTSLEKSRTLEKENKNLKQEIEFYKNKSKQNEEDKVLEEKKEKPMDIREKINADSQSVEPEIRKAIKHETSANALVTALEEIVSIHDDEVEDFELFNRYLSTLNYKTLLEAKEKIENIIKIGGYQK
ncbi:TPA: DUF3102 domain-containing protein [Staphylococcus aureus]|uniref:DUF3102 domain-containing protein n=1 Tax=Staphylococcus aureus TaxID=1280 RepID=UPI000DFA4312|nr:DUF3102 domain-containing protein [Staphylococcus aureus]SUL22774.1 phage protein [Staphylococcus aureus]HDA1993619.1 DUF3102 domain-containing protein [Staphylococcus aureus]HDA2068045.1 DUF3102 domain-containing protein [Staphylococcus aureus]HDA2710546.1 DUF3102 domain-containing protein [Staphylococcus aureus]HDH5591615.1 DUF3102 domain-containing protein [Staphylococcus aureus]